ATAGAAARAADAAGAALATTAARDNQTLVQCEAAAPNVGCAAAFVGARATSVEATLTADVDLEGLARRDRDSGRRFAAQATISTGWTDANAAPALCAQQVERYRAHPARDRPGLGATRIWDVCHDAADDGGEAARARPISRGGGPASVQN